VKKKNGTRTRPGVNRHQRGVLVWRQHEVLGMRQQNHRCQRKQRGEHVQKKCHRSTCSVFCVFRSSAVCAVNDLLSNATDALRCYSTTNDETGAGDAPCAEQTRQPRALELFDVCNFVGDTATKERQ
jgi:hypothetical protein